MKYIDDNNIEVSVDGKGTQKYVIDPGLSRRITSIEDSRGTLKRSYDTRDSLNLSIDRDGNQTEYYYSNGLLTDSKEYIGDQTSGKRRDLSIFRDEVGRRIGGQVSLLDGGKYRTSLMYRRTYDASGKLLAECRLDASLSTASGYNCGSQAIPPSGVRQVRYDDARKRTLSLANAPLWEHFFPSRIIRIPSR